VGASNVPAPACRRVPAQRPIVERVFLGGGGGSNDASLISPRGIRSIAELGELVIDVALADHRCDCRTAENSAGSRRCRPTTSALETIGGG